MLTTVPLRGFTLIELLVVVAIISILSSIVLSSLNMARQKGLDSATKSNFESLRLQGEIFYDTSNSYLSFCTSATTTKILLGAAQSSGAASIVTGPPGSSLTTVVCHSSIGAWGATAPLRIPSGAALYWCVDSTGTSSAKVDGLFTGDIACH